MYTGLAHNLVDVLQYVSFKLELVYILMLLLSMADPFLHLFLSLDSIRKEDNLIGEPECRTSVFQFNMNVFCSDFGSVA